MTDGRADTVVFRAQNVYQDEKPMGLDRPLYFRLFNDTTKASGVARREVDGTVKVLTMDDALIGGVVKAKDVDRMLFSLQTFEKSPNVYVTNGLFKEAKPLTRTNPQQANFLWGKSELVHYKSTWGKDLAGVLIYPADYDRGPAIPMVTYIYEKLSDGLHAYRIPSNAIPTTRRCSLRAATSSSCPTSHTAFASLAFRRCSVWSRRSRR